jgi:hypothetical protein
MIQHEVDKYRNGSHKHVMEVTPPFILLGEDNSIVASFWDLSKDSSIRGMVAAIKEAVIATPTYVDAQGDRKSDISGDKNLTWHTVGHYARYVKLDGIGLKKSNNPEEWEKLNKTFGENLAFVEWVRTEFHCIIHVL